MNIDVIIDTSNDASFDVSDITIAYRKSTILDVASSSFPRGVVSGIIGANGAGKTTFFRGLSGAVPLAAGNIRLDGESVHVSSAEWQRRITLIPGDNALFEDLTVEQHFELMSILFGIGRSESGSRQETLISIFSLAPYGRRMAGELSFGYRKRLAIALALFRDADVYLFDEPFNGLDVGSLDVFRSIIDRLARLGRIVVIASHAVGLIRDLCAEIWTIASGRLSLLDGGLNDGDEPRSGIDSGSEMEMPWLDPTDI